MTFVPNTGPVNTTQINNAFGLGEDLNNYHVKRWYYPGNLTTGFFSGATINISDFFGKQPNDPATAGVYFANTSGSFGVPLYRNSITIEIWGGGGSGGSGNGDGGSKGGDSSVLGVTAGGGSGGSAGNIPVPAPPVNTNTFGKGSNYTYSVGVVYYSDNSVAGYVTTNFQNGTAVAVTVTDASGNYVSSSDP